MLAAGMDHSKTTATRKTVGELPADEARLWRGIGAVWSQLYGSFHEMGLSFEWHEFTAEEEVDWAGSFHPSSIEICLNLSGSGKVVADSGEAVFGPCSAGFYRQAETPLKAFRNGGEKHQFVTVEYAPTFLARHLGRATEGLHPMVSGAIREDCARSGVGPARRMASGEQQMVQSLVHPPVHAKAQRLWYESKALELAAVFLFQQPKEEFFCDRQKRLAQERVGKVVEILRENLSEPPGVEELGRRVGCSHFYLSRSFTKEMGQTISQYLRQLRMERAAELLRSGKYNVTEAALEVGYNSLSHFSHAFRETHGCCPGLYPLAANHALIRK